VAIRIAAVVCVTAALIAALTGQARGDDPPFSASHRVIVVSDQAEAFAGEDSVGRIAPGRVLEYTQENGQWLLIARLKGWLDRKHVVAIERGKAFFDDIIKKDPSAEAFHHRGIVLAELGQYEAAIRDFDRALAEGAEDPGLFINRGNARQRSGDVAAALEDYSRAIELDRANAQAFDSRAGALAALGRLDESLVDSDQAILLDPTSPEAHNNRGVTRRMLGDLQGAITDYSKSIELYPRYAAAYGNRGYIQKQLGDFESAIADYERAIEIQPNSPVALNDLAWLLATCRNDEVRDPKRAIELATSACKQTQFADANLLDTLATSHAAAGDFDAALKRCDEALRVADESDREAIASRRALFAAEKPYFEE